MTTDAAPLAPRPPLRPRLGWSAIAPSPTLVVLLQPRSRHLLRVFQRTRRAALSFPWLAPRVRLLPFSVPSGEGGSLSQGLIIRSQGQSVTLSLSSASGRHAILAARAGGIEGGTGRGGYGQIDFGRYFSYAGTLVLSGTRFQQVFLNQSFQWTPLQFHLPGQPFSTLSPIMQLTQSFYNPSAMVLAGGAHGGLQFVHQVHPGTRIRFAVVAGVGRQMHISSHGVQELQDPPAPWFDLLPESFLSFEVQQP